MKDHSQEPAFVSPELVWIGAILHRTGYATAARNHLRGLHRLSFPVHVREMWKNSSFPMSGEDMDWFSAMSRHKPAPNSVCVIMHPPGMHPTGGSVMENTRYANPGMGRYIAYTMFETDRIPASWVERLEAVDEIWVPTQFNKQTFLRSGVDESRLRVMPLSLDTDFFDARRHFPKREPGEEDFKFLSVFEWLPRKGWDVLVRAYCQEFAREERVSLNLRTHRGLAGNPGLGKQSIQEELEAFARKELGKGLKDLPAIRIDESRLPDDQLPSYYLGHNAFVSTSRGEGWGMPMMEAMSLGLPTAAPRWGGPLEFMNDANSYLIGIEGVVSVKSDMVLENPIYAGHRWAEPSVEDARRVLRKMFSDHEEGRRKAKIAREELVGRFSLDVVAKQVAARVNEIAGEPVSRGLTPSVPSTDPKSTASPPAKTETPWRVAIRSGSSRSFGHQRADYELSRALTPESGMLLVEENESPDFLISHDDPPSLELPPQGCRWIWFARWPYGGGVPEAWLPVLLHQVDEIWATSEFTRQAYLRAGVPESKVRIVPLGVDSNLFRSDVRPLALSDKSGFRFLSVLALDERQSFEGLLGAYTEAFKSADDVCLVLKLVPTNLEAQKKSESLRLLEVLRTCPAFGKVELLDGELSEGDMAGLYAACDAFVAPYAASFHRTALLEAMAAGVPVIAPASPIPHDALDPVHEGFAFPVPSASTPVNLAEAVFPNEALFPLPIEMTLAEVMKAVRKNPEIARLRAEKAQRFVREQRTWPATAKFFRGRMESLCAKDSAQSVATSAAQETVSPLLRLDPEGGGAVGSVRRAANRNPHRPLLLATSSFEAPFDVVAELAAHLDRAPEAAAVVFKQRQGAVSLWRPGLHRHRLPVYENFQTGAYLLDLVRDASSQGLSIRMEMRGGLRFRVDPLYAREREAVEALVLAQELRSGGRIEDAVSQALQSLKLKPDYAAALAEAVELLVESDRMQEAQALATRLLSMAPGWSRSRHLLGLALVQAGKESEGGAWVYQASQMDPTNHLIMFDLAQLYQRCGNLEQAFQCYRRAWSQCPGSIEYLSRCMEVLAENPGIPGAEDFLREVRTRNPGLEFEIPQPREEAVGVG